MNLKNILKHIIRRTARIAAGVCMLTGLASCDGMIYDGEGDCDPHYKVRFVYDRNLKYTDAFAAEVDEVTLYIADRDGNVVWRKHEAGDALRSGSYMMDVEGLEPGTYSLLAWCGSGHTTDFSIPGDAGRLTDLQATLGGRTAHDAGWDFQGSAVRDDFRDLYHGKLVDVTFPDTQGTHVFEVNLTKDTNDVHVVLQHLSGDPVDESRFLFTIEEESGKMDWDNTVLSDDPLRFYAHTVTSGSAGVEVPDYRGDGQGGEADSRAAITQVSCAVADFQVSRITPRQPNVVRIYNRDTKELVAAIPLADYALITKGKHAKLSDEDYLDYRDDYSLVLFLDDNGRWINTQIYINSWHIILQDVNPQ